jgi:DNA-binding transcriptional LysR family regulator
VARADLFLSPFVVVASRGNKALRDAADGATMPLNLFCGLPHVLRSVDGSMTGMTDTALAAVGLRRRVVLTLPQFEAVLRAVAQSDMISVVPVQLARELADGLGLVIFQPPIAIPAPTMSLYWHRRHDQLPAQAWLRAEVQTLCARMWGAQG